MHEKSCRLLRLVFASVKEVRIETHGLDKAPSPAGRLPLRFILRIIMNRFAILRGIAPPPLPQFKEGIAEEIFKTVSNFTSVENQPDREGLSPQQNEPVRVHARMNPGLFNPVVERQVNHMGVPMSGRAHAMSQHVAVEQQRETERAIANMSDRAPFLTVRMPSGDEHQVRRDQIHIHPHPNGGFSNYELHLNLPDNLASRIFDELHPPYNDELQRAAEISRRYRAVRGL